MENLCRPIHPDFSVTVNNIQTIMNVKKKIEPATANTNVTKSAIGMLTAESD